MGSFAGGLRGPGSSIMASPNESTNEMIHQRVVDTVRFLHGAETRANNLRQAVNALPEAFRPRTATSSNTDILTITNFTGSNLADKSVVIHQLATPQRNEGVGLNRLVPVENSGTFEFEIEVDGETRRLSFNVGANESVTNQQFQQRMANAINNANIGLTASVHVNGTNSTINIITRTTGEGKEGEPRFTLIDITGNAVEFTGINNITQEGQNALFTIGEGEQQSSVSNEVNIGGGLTVTFHQLSEEPIEITLGQDLLHIQNAARNLVNHFNALLESATNNSGDSRTRLLARQLQGAANMSRRALADIGIMIGEGGFLSINAERMNAAAENGNLERFLNGNGNRQAHFFTSRVERISENLARNPMRHVSANATRLPGFDAAWNAISNGQNITAPQAPPNPFGNMTPEDLLGMLFNSTR